MSTWILNWVINHLMIQLTQKMRNLRGINKNFNWITITQHYLRDY